jgi:hypothetical protein
MTKFMAYLKLNKYLDLQTRTFWIFINTYNPNEDLFS